MSGRISKELRPVVDEALTLGFTLEKAPGKRAGHPYRLVPPGGGPGIPVPSSSSSNRGPAYLRTAVRRALREARS